MKTTVDDMSSVTVRKDTSNSYVVCVHGTPMFVITRYDGMPCDDEMLNIIRLVLHSAVALVEKET